MPMEWYWVDGRGLESQRHREEQNCIRVRSGDWLCFAYHSCIFKMEDSWSAKSLTLSIIQPLKQLLRYTINPEPYKDANSQIAWVHTMKLNHPMAKAPISDLWALRVPVMLPNGNSCLFVSCQLFQKHTTSCTSQYHFGDIIVKKVKIQQHPVTSKVFPVNNAQQLMKKKNFAWRKEISEVSKKWYFRKILWYAANEVHISLPLSSARG